MASELATCAWPKSRDCVSPKRLTTFWKVRSVLSLFIQMGCDLRVAEGDGSSDEGDVLNFRYLYNPENQAFAPILDLGDDEYVSEGEVNTWERRLGVTIPKPT
jgi:hypothetical protein